MNQVLLDVREIEHRIRREAAICNHLIGRFKATPEREQFNGKEGWPWPEEANVCHVSIQQPVNLDDYEGVLMPVFGNLAGHLEWQKKTVSDILDFMHGPFKAEDGKLAYVFNVRYA